MPRAGSVMGPEPLFHGGTVVQPFWKATQNVPPVSPLGGFPKGLRDVHAIIGGYLGQVRTVDYRGGVSGFMGAWLSYLGAAGFGERVCGCLGYLGSHWVI